MLTDCSVGRLGKR